VRHGLALERLADELHLVVAAQVKSESRIEAKLKAVDRISVSSA
jgi:hypothetical protein